MVFDGEDYKNVFGAQIHQCGLFEEKWSYSNFKHSYSKIRPAFLKN